MSVDGTIVERWIARTLESYPVQSLPFLRGEQDPFRNPVGHALRENLVILVDELLGSMDKNRAEGAVDALVRMRAVQNFRPGEALRFLFDLRTVVGEVSGAVPESLQCRIDELALMAFDRYMSCREQLFNLRMKELRLSARYDAAEEGDAL